MCKIEKIIPVRAGTKALTVPVHGLACLIQNNSADATVYFKETREDGKPVTADNGWALPPGAETQVPMVAMELSVIATAEADVRVMVLDFG